MASPFKIFIAYARKDKALLGELRNHLKPLERTSRAEIWCDELIEPGDVWENSIKQNLYSADIILLLISSDSIGSDYFYEKEMTNAITRHEKGKVKVVPIIIRDCDWENMPFSKIQVLPKNGKHVTSWVDRDNAWVDIVKSLRNLISEMEAERKLKAEEEEKRRQEEIAQQKAAEEEKRRREEIARKKTEEEKRRLQEIFRQVEAEAEKQRQGEAAYKKALEEVKRRQAEEEQQLRLKIKYVSTLDKTQLDNMTWSELYEIVQVLRIGSSEISKKGLIQAILQANGYNISCKELASEQETRIEIEPLQEILGERLPKVAQELIAATSTKETRIEIEPPQEILGKRLPIVAQELNVATSTIVEFLGTKGYHIGNKPTSIVPEELESILHQEFQASKATKIKADAMTIGVRPPLIRKPNEGANIQDPFANLMVKIEGGTFEMGDIFGEGYDCEKPVHKVTVKDFYLCKYPVTQTAWKKIMGEDNNPSYFKGDDLPVENVCWSEAQNFIKRLNEKTGSNYRLPTEAEWEYAARERGRIVRFANGKNTANPKEINFDSRQYPNKMYHILGEYRGKTTPVGSLNCPNILGLHDMSGNVWEWCQDVWHNRYQDAPNDGSAWLNGGEQGRRVVRGGDCRGSYLVYDCRAALRCPVSENYPGLNPGFRLAR